MPMICVVYGCTNRSNRETTRSFYRVPKVVVHKGEQCKKLTEKRRKQWLDNLCLRSAGAESGNARVCSDHFVSGCPSALKDTESVDWAPTVNLDCHEVKPMFEASPLREEMMASREDQQRQREGASALLDLSKSAENQEPEDIAEILHDRSDAGCQTDLTMDDIERMEDVLKQTTTELGDLRTKALDTQFSQESFEKNDDKTKFYTGLPNFLVLMQVFQMCEPYISCGPLSVLSKFEQVILVLLRLRLNLPLKDLAFRFNVSYSTISRVWQEVIGILHARLDFLIELPERDVLQATMPMAFRQAFGCRVAVIVDCFEVFIERPSNLLAKTQTWSNYKHHHTVKFLIGVAPQGYVSYVSPACGGRVSDKQITEESDLLRNLLPGDIVLADREFNVGDSVGFYCALLQIPAIAKGKRQLSPYQVEKTRETANVRNHVERVTGLVRKKYQILQSRALPIEHVVTTSGESMSLIDKIGVICCALSNLSESVVPLD